MNTLTSWRCALVGTPPPGLSGQRLLVGHPGTDRPVDLTEHLHRLGPPPAADATLIEAVTAAGLTGRGGAGFPTGRKMRAVAQHARRGAVLVANGMESEPASHKDHTLLALAPHLVIDGAVLAATAVNAPTAHLCLPRSHTHLIDLLTSAVEERQSARLDPVEVRIHALPHGYVTSEASALVHWLNGGPARPLSSPPHPREQGVRARPTLVHNVETLAHIALIARHGPDWFRQAGTPDSPGTTLVTIAGAVHNPGAREIEAGTPIGTILAAGGGPSTPLQAVLIGGYAGSWVPTDNAVELSFSACGLAPAGASLGAGVILALPHAACGLTETARILDYLAANGAQQCGPCLFGQPAVAHDFTALAQGHTHPELLPRLHKRISLLTGRGACRHPDGAARLAASALHTFHADVEYHHTHGFCQRPRALPIPSAHPVEQWR